VVLHKREKGALNIERHAKHRVIQRGWAGKGEGEEEHKALHLPRARRRHNKGLSLYRRNRTLKTTKRLGTVVAVVAEGKPGSNKEKKKKPKKVEVNFDPSI